MIDNLSRYWVDENGCWIWGGYVQKRTGYPKTSRPIHGTMFAHRMMYIEHVGEIPTGLDIDHLCRVRHCVNPAHLEPATRSENTRRGITGYGARSQCRNGGHDITNPENVMTEKSGRRRCLPCRKNTEAQRDAKRRGIGFIGPSHSRARSGS